MLITFLAVHFSLFYLLWTSSAFFTFKCEQLVWSIFRFGTFNRFPICYCLLQCPIDVLQADTVAQAFSFTCFIEPLVFHLRLESIEMASHIEISLSLSLVSNKLLITSRDISFSLSLSLSLFWCAVSGLCFSYLSFSLAISITLSPISSLHHHTHALEQSRTSVTKLDNSATWAIFQVFGNFKWGLI